MRTAPVDALLLFVSLLSLIIPFLVVSRNRKDPVNLSFAAFALSGSLWAFNVAMFRMAADMDWAWFWNRALYAVGGLPAVAFLYFSFVFPSQKKPLSPLAKAVLFLPLAMFAYFIFFTSGLFIKNVFLSAGGNRAELGPIYPIWLGWFGLFMGAAVFNLLRTYRKVAGITKLQLKFMLLSVIPPMVFSVPFNLVLPYWGNYQLIWLGPLSLLGMVAIVFYAIARHRFLDIRLALRTILVKLSLFFILFFIFIMTRDLVARSVGFWLLVDEWSFFALLFLLVFSFEKLDGLVRFATDRFLFQREYSQREMLRQLGKTITQILEVGSLMENIRKALVEVMHVSFVGFLILPKSSGAGGGSRPLSEAVVEGLDPARKAWLLNSFLFRQLEKSGQILVYDELKEKPPGEKDPKAAGLIEVMHDMEDIKAVVAIPLLTSEGLGGAIFIGEKKGGDAFSSLDFDTFELLMYQAGIVLENALLFARTQDFNLKLKREVARSTAALANRNRRLMILRRLDMIIMNTLDLTEMCQKIMDTVSWEMGYEGGLIALLNEEGDALRPYAVSENPPWRKFAAFLPERLESLRFSVLGSPENLLSRALRERRPLATEDLAELYHPPLTLAQARQLGRVSSLKHHVVYPLSAKGRPLGVVVFALDHAFPTLSLEEKELMAAFMDEAGIAVENATLYQQTKEDKENLEKAYAKLQELDKLKDEFISITSHELRTPMSSVKGYLWMLSHKGKPLDATQQRYWQRAWRGTDQMINLINDTLNVSRIEQGRADFKIVPLDLTALLQETVEGLRGEAEEKGLEITLAADPAVKVLADTARVREVVGNLLENAIKFTHRGSIKVTVSLGKKEVKVAVADTGRGIAPEDTLKLFRKFGRLEHSFVTMAESSGSGLGLYLSKLLVEKMGGHIGVDSILGKGATFWFTLPRVGI